MGELEHLFVWINKTGQPDVGEIAIPVYDSGFKCWGKIILCIVIVFNIWHYVNSYNENLHLQ